MSQEDKNLSHAAPEPVEELEALKDWWDSHGNKVTILMIAVLVAVVGFQQYGRWHERSTSKALSDFDSARTPEALEEIIATDASQAVTPLARLRLANIYFADEKFTLAQSTYEAFLQKNAKHPFAAIAEVGLAHCLEATGQAAQAADKFRAFADANPKSFLAPTARLGEGRSLILAGKKDEGKKVLDLFITENAGTRWAAYADELIKAKNRLALPSAPAAADLSTFFSAETPAMSTNATDTVKTAPTQALPQVAPVNAATNSAAPAK